MTKSSSTSADPLPNTSEYAKKAEPVAVGGPNAIGFEYMLKFSVFLSATSIA